jgi:osmoprotectant transport system permease protein
MGDAWSDMWTFLHSDDAWSGRDGLPSLLWAHVQLSVVALLVAALVAIPPAVVLGHVRRGALAAVSIVNIGRAIPSFAIIALLFPISLRYHFELGFGPTAIALILLAIPPIFTNTYTGVRDVDPGVVESARGMGMRARELLTRVEVPNALPLIITGLRVAAVQVVATATLGALVGYGGLGALIIKGTAQQDDGKLLTGALFVALLAILTELAFGAFERRSAPWLGRGRTRGGAAAVADEPSTAVPDPASAIV